MQGREDGLSQGWAEGQRQTLYTIAQNLLHKKQSLDFIMHVTGLSLDEILKLKEEVA